MAKDKTILKLKKELEKAKAQAEEYLNGWRRARADYINREREIEEEKARWIKFANQEFILEFLPILDSFQGSLNQIPEGLKRNLWTKGILQISSQIDDFLKVRGVEKIKTIGEKFDPGLHEAVEKKGNKNEIIKEVQPGYKIHGEVIRPAKVVIK